jgi:hypothetical protein
VIESANVVLTFAGRRLQEVEQPQDVRQEDEHREGADDVEEPVAGTVADDVLEQALQPPTMSSRNC